MSAHLTEEGSCAPKYERPGLSPGRLDMNCAHLMLSYALSPMATQNLVHLVLEVELKLFKTRFL